MDAEMEKDGENDLVKLAELITARAHFLAPGNGDAILAQQAKQVLKASFDRGVYFCDPS